MELLVPRDTQDVIDTWCAKLSVAFQRQIDAGTVKVYREALADLPPWAIESAGVRLMREGGEFFPTTAKWHRYAEAALDERGHGEIAVPLPAEHECETCRDTGWAEEDREDRTVCIPCTCRPWNKTYQRNTLASSYGHGTSKASKGE